jgi:hypothetical protein
MSFKPDVKREIIQYVHAQLPTDDWYDKYFDFVADEDLRKRLSEEFKATRAVYKLFRGLDAIDWWQRAEVRIQVLQYASIYEAVIHHILFDRLGSTEEVRRLVEHPKLVRISIPTDKQALLEKTLDHHGKGIVPTYQGTVRVDQSKVRFDDKMECAVELDLVEPGLAEDLVRIYEARNAIHLHAELRKNQKYEIELARTAYRRLQPFREQLLKGLSKRGLLIGVVENLTLEEDLQTNDDA